LWYLRRTLFDLKTTESEAFQVKYIASAVTGLLGVIGQALLMYLGFGWEGVLFAGLADYLCFWLGLSILVLLEFHVLDWGFSKLIDRRNRRERRKLAAERDAIVQKMKSCITAPTAGPYRIQLIDSNEAAKKHQIFHVTPDCVDDLSRLETVEKELARAA
jgi:hypothetical protein